MRPVLLSIVALTAWAVGLAVPVAAADFDTSLVSPMPRDWAVNALTVGQFKGDGHSDAAVVGNYGSKIRVMLGNGDGTFRAGADYPVTGDPLDITNADLRGNAKRDLIVGTQTTVCVLLGNGDGSFQPAQVVATLTFVRRVLTADVRGIGRTDIVVTQTSGISVLLGNGDGTFQAPITTAIQSPGAIAVGDLSGSRHPDLIYVAGAGFEVRPGNGDGTFGPPIAYPGGQPGNLLLAPLHGGDLLDLVATYGSPSRVTVFAGNGDRTFQAPGDTYALEAIAGPTAITAADLRQVGTMDLVVGCGDVHVLLGRGDGSFAAPEIYPIRDVLNGVVVTDLRGTGVEDIVVGRAFGRDIATLLGAGDGTFPKIRLVQAHAGPAGVVAGDFGTGHLSLAVQNRDSNDLSIVLGNGDGTFQPAVHFPLPYPAGALRGALAAGDFRGNGVLDIAALQSGGVSILRGNGDGTFQAIGGVSLSGRPTAIATADMRGNNRPDLLVTTTNPNFLYVVLNNGDGTFAQPVGYALPNWPFAIAAGDFRGIGIADVAVTIAAGVVVYRANGDGTLGTTVTYPAPATAVALVAAPLRQAGLIDLAYTAQPASDPNTATVELLLNDGTGSFTAGGSYTIGGFPLDLAVADLDGCGRLDIIAASTSSGAVSILKNLGGGGFGPARHFGAGVQPLSLVIGDFNEDGRLDIATASDWGVDLLLGI